MAGMTAQAVPILSDNYAWLLRDPATGYTAVVDPAEEAPIMAAITAAGGRLDAILLTHHHQDHIAAVEPLRHQTGAQVIGHKSMRTACRRWMRQWLRVMWCRWARWGR